MVRPVGMRIVNDSDPKVCLKVVSEYQAKDLSICTVGPVGFEPCW